jgi:tight adherence protein C
MLIGAQFLISLIIGFSVLTLVLGIRALVTPAGSNTRMQQLINASEPVTLRELEMGASFFERAIKPLSTTLLRLLGRLAPQSNVQELHRKLETAGFPANLSVADFLGIKILASLFLGTGMALLGYMFRSDSLLLVAGAGLVFGLAGFLLPNFWLSRRVTARQTEIRKALPDALDMMTSCVDGGLGLSGARQRVCDNWDSALVEEFTRVLTETRLGRSRIEAMENMAKRTAVKEVISFIGALVLADKLGANIANVLHIQAEQMRIARRQRAEQLAREAGIKMLFPLVFLIFPAMFAVILGPAVPQLLETLGRF